MREAIDDRGCRPRHGALAGYVTEVESPLYRWLRAYGAV